MISKLYRLITLIQIFRTRHNAKRYTTADSIKDLSKVDLDMANYHVDFCSEEHRVPREYLKRPTTDEARVVRDVPNRKATLRDAGAKWIRQTVDQLGQELKRPFQSVVGPLGGGNARPMMRPRFGLRPI